MKNKYDGQLVLGKRYDGKPYLENKIICFDYITDRMKEIYFLESFFENYTEEFSSYISRPNKTEEHRKEFMMKRWIYVSVLFNEVVEKYYFDKDVLCLPINQMQESEEVFLVNIINLLENINKLFNIDLYDFTTDTYLVLDNWSKTNLEGKKVLSIVEAENLIKEKLNMDVIIDNLS